MPRSRRQPGDLILGVYEVIDLAGVGATSYVYVCRPRGASHDQRFAIKVLHDDLRAKPAARRRFLREAKLMQALDHENIVAVHEVVETPKVSAYVMDLVEGPTLKEWASYARAVGRAEDVLAVFLDILSGVGCAHTNGIIHRDLKPANILLEVSGPRPVPKIIDFGVARLAEAPPDPEDLGTIRGTAAYISPEEIRSPHEVCASSDLYSLGVVLYEVTSGVRPFQGRPSRELMTAHFYDAPSLPSDHEPSVHPAVESVILGMLAKHPDLRYQCAFELRDTLRAAIELSSAIQVEEAVPLAVPAAPWKARAGSLFGAVLDFMLGPGLTGLPGDPHHLARPHVELPGFL